MKKLNKLFAILVAMAMVLSLTVISAFAATDAAKSSAVGTDATIGASKTFTIPVGTTIPSDTFGLTITQIKTDEDRNEAYEATDATYTSTVTAKAAPNAGAEATAANATQIINYPNILNGAKFTKAGVYAFDVTETAPTVAENTATNTYAYAAPTYTRTATADDGVVTTETITYSQAKYRLIVGVASYTNEDNKEDFYIDTIQAKMLVNDAGENQATAPKPEGDKNPTTGNPAAVDFDNSYLKKVTNPDPVGGEEKEPKTPDPTDGKTLFISKAITADEGVTIDKSKVFQFTATVTFPAGAGDYKYKITDADGTDSTEFTVYKPATGNSATFTFELTHGQRLVFTDIAIGATWTVSEATYPAYTATITTSNNGLVKDSGQNKSVVENAYNPDKDPATGLSIANLPFIVLALVAVGGLVAYVIVRRKSEDNA